MIRRSRLVHAASSLRALALHALTALALFGTVAVAQEERIPVFAVDPSGTVTDRLVGYAEVLNGGSLLVVDLFLERFVADFVFEWEAGTYRGALRSGVWTVVSDAGEVPSRVDYVDGDADDRDDIRSPDLGRDDEDRDDDLPVDDGDEADDDDRDDDDRDDDDGDEADDGEANDDDGDDDDTDDDDEGDDEGDDDRDDDDEVDDETS